jgi:hypothetical protein
VAALGYALGTCLSTLDLQQCVIDKTFWPAVWGGLPVLQVLQLGPQVQGAVGMAHLAAFCSRAARPLTLRLCMGQAGEVLYDVQELEGLGRAWGAPKVTCCLL